MKRTLISISSYVAVLALMGLAMAQDFSGLIGEALGTEWGALFTEGSVLAGVIVLLIKLVDTIKPGLIHGPTKYYTAIALGVIAGVVGDVAGFLSVPDLSDFPTPLAGITFGLTAALSAVGLHQGKTQTSEALRDISTRRVQ